MGQGGKQHVRGPAPWGLAALEPVPLLLGAGWVGDLDRWPAPHARARLTVRTQPSHAKLAGEAHIAQPVAQPSHLVVQGAGPDVRIVGEPGGQVGHERLQRVGRRAAPAGGPLTPHVGTDRLRIAVEMTGDGRDRPSPLAQCVHLHVFSPCEHGAGTPSGCGLAPPASRESHSCWWTSNGQPECSGVGRFSDRVRGVSRDPHQGGYGPISCALACGKLENAGYSDARAARKQPPCAVARIAHPAIAPVGTAIPASTALVITLQCSASHAKQVVWFVSSCVVVMRSGRVARARPSGAAAGPGRIG